MVTAIQLTDEFVRVMAGKPGRKQIEIQKAFQKRLPAGSIINGAIQSEEEVERVLTELWQEHGLAKKRVRVVINALPVTVKKFEFPAMKEKELRHVIEQELDIQPEEEIFDYMKLGSGHGTVSVYAAVGQRAYLEKYRDVFLRAGLRPERFVLSRICLEKSLSHMETITNQPCIVQVLNGKHMASVLWVNGEALYTMRTILEGEYGSFQFGLEVSRAVSNLLQFYMTQEKHQKLQTVYLSGIAEEDFLLCAEAISQMVPEVEAERLEHDAAITESGSVELSFGEYLRLAGALFEQKSEINLLPSQRKTKRQKAPSEVWRYAELPLILAVGCGVITAALLFSNNLKQTMLDELNAYVEDAANLQNCAQVDALDAENVRLESQVKAAEYVEQALASYPAANSSVLEAIERCARGKAEVCVESYLAGDGLLTLAVETSGAERCSQLVEALQELGLFERIDYTGYAYSGQDQAYRATLLCYLQEAAGKKEVDG